MIISKKTKRATTHPASPPPLKTHLLSHGTALRVACCGVEYIDPDGERVTAERAQVTCRLCRRAARLDGQGVKAKDKQT